MSKSKELITKQHPISAGDILGMVAAADDFVAVVTAAILLLDKANKKAIELGLSEAVPPTIQ